MWPNPQESADLVTFTVKKSLMENFVYLFTLKAPSQMLDGSLNTSLFHLCLLSIFHKIFKNFRCVFTTLSNLYDKAVFAKISCLLKKDNYFRKIFSSRMFDRVLSTPLKFTETIEFTRIILLVTSIWKGTPPWEIFWEILSHNEQKKLNACQ